MKTLFILFSLITSISASAEQFRLKDSLCGEIDPFVIGDACVLVLENKGKESVLITDVDFMVSLSEKELTQGQFFDLDFKAVEAVDKKTSKQMKQILTRSMNLSRKAKFFYLDNNEGLKNLDIELKTRQITCEANNVSGDGFLDATISFSATLETYGDFSNLKDLKFEYKLTDGGDTWSEGDTAFASLTNSINYNPQVYVGYDKFNFWLSSRSRGFGQFDLIIPVKRIIDNDQAFSAQVIMTSIDDHHGDSVSIECF